MFLLDGTCYFVGHPPMTFVGRDVVGGFVFRTEGLLKTFSIGEVDALVVQRPKPPPKPEFVWLVRDFSPRVRYLLKLVFMASAVLLLLWFSYLMGWLR